MTSVAAAQPVDLLEREHELTSVRAALRSVSKQQGRVVLIDGAAGMGKSRLLEAARAAASVVGIRVLDARGSELERGFPFGVARQLFERPLMEADGAERKRWLAGAGALAWDLLTTTPPADRAEPPADPGYAWQHGLYWLASNLSADAPLLLAIDDVQWCDAPSVRALAFIARRLEGQALGLILATRPLDPAATPEAATLVAEARADILRPSPLTPAAVAALVSARLGVDPHDRFVGACLEVTGGNPFLIGELLDEAVARGVEPSAATAADVNKMVPRGVANAVLLRLARLAPAAGAFARAASALGDGSKISDVARLARVGSDALEGVLPALVAAGVIDAGASVRFAHPILRSAVYEDLSAAERERLHRAAVGILRERQAPAIQVATQIMHTEPRADPETVALLRKAARDALGLGDPTGAAALLSRALDEPPTEAERSAVVLDLGQALARAGAPEAIAPLSEIVEHSEDPGEISAAAIELSAMLFFAGRAPEGAPVLRRALERISIEEPARERLEVALLGTSYTSASAWREAGSAVAARRDPGGPARGVLQATTLATLAMDEVMHARSASAAIDLAERALALGLPPELHRGENWAGLALAALTLADALDAALKGTDEILASARQRGAVLTVVAIGALRAIIALRRGDLAAAQADAQEVIDLAPDLLGGEFLVLAVAAAVMAGLERDESPDSLRHLIERTGVSYDDEFMPSCELRYASGILRAAAGNHESAVEELRACALLPATFGGQNPAVLPWRSAAAQSLSELGRHAEARALAADELRRALSFGAPRAIGIAWRAQAIVGPRADRLKGLEEALRVLESSGARLEHARVLVDIGAELRSAGQRNAAREPLLDALARAARCGARPLERRARAELAAIGIRPRATDRSGPDSLTPSELRVAELAATGVTNREIAQALFVTEKTVETHLGRAFRKLEISSRRQLPDVLTPPPRP